MTSILLSRPAPSDHYDGKRFFNPGIDTDKGFADLLRWQRTRDRAPWPPHVANPPPQPLPAVRGPNEMAVTFIGHSTYLVRVAGCTILTDPIFSERASPVSFAGPKRARDPGMAIDALPPIDVILLSHNHYDHMDLASLRRLCTRSNPVIVTGLRNGVFLESKGIGGAVELDWWGRTEVEGLGVTYVPAQHWSSRTMWDRRRMLWGGHVVETPAGLLYFAGDTGYFGGFKEIRARLGAPAVAILPIGAYEPRWFMTSQHMNPAEAVQAHIELGADLSLAAHWGTFQLTDEGIDEPVLALERAKREQGVKGDRFVAPLPGESVLWRNLHQEEAARFS